MGKISAHEILVRLVSFLVGGVFIISAISKLPSLESFGWTIVETTFLNWTAAEWAARILIGLEFFLGVLFIFHIRIKKIAIPLSLTLLAIFSLYLLLVMKQYGTSGNCGCFGELIPMTPLESLVKNILLILLIVFISKNRFEFQFQFLNWIVAIILLVCLLVPFIHTPPESIYICDKENPMKHPIPLSYLYSSPINKPPSSELRKGKHIISFMSLTCGYCRKAAKRLRIMKEKYPQLPIYLILNGDSKNLKPFFDDTHATNIEYSVFNGAELFARMNDGTSLPTIKWVEDTTVVRTSNYVTLDEKDILQWIK